MNIEEFFNTEQVYWFLTRAAGLLAWVFASGSILVGLLMGSKMFGRRPGLPWLLDFHRFLSIMALFFVAVHMLTLWADTFVEFGFAELFVPGTAMPNYTTMSISVGVVAMWLMIIVQLTSVFKDYFPHRFWHTIHLFSFVVVFMGAYHGYETGSEADNIYVVAIGASIIAAIVLGTIARIIGSRQAKKYKKYRQDVLNTTKTAVLSRANEE